MKGCFLCCECFCKFRVKATVIGLEINPSALWKTHMWARFHHCFSKANKEKEMRYCPKLLLWYISKFESANSNFSNTYCLTLSFVCKIPLFRPHNQSENWFSVILPQFSTEPFVLTYAQCILIAKIDPDNLGTVILIRKYEAKIIKKVMVDMTMASLKIK